MPHHALVVQPYPYTLRRTIRSHVVYMIEIGRRGDEIMTTLWHARLKKLFTTNWKQTFYKTLEIQANNVNGATTQSQVATLLSITK